MKQMNKAVRKLVPFSIGIMLLILCGTGAGPVAALPSLAVPLGDIYANALYENIGLIPIAGNENGWTNTNTGKSISFYKEGGDSYYIADSAASASLSSISGTYSKAITGTKYQINVRYPTVPVIGEIYLSSNLLSPIGNLIGETVSTDYYIRLAVPATLGWDKKVTGMAITNPDKSLTRIVGTNNGDYIEFRDSLAEYEPGVWTVTPVFRNGHDNGFSSLAPSYMYGEPVTFTVKQADNSIKLEVSKTTKSESATPKQTPATPVATTAPQKDDGSLQPATPASTEVSATSTQQSPAPFIGILAGFGVAAILLRLRR